MDTVPLMTQSVSYVNFSVVKITLIFKEYKTHAKLFLAWQSGMLLINTYSFFLFDQAFKIAGLTDHRTSFQGNLSSPVAS